MARKLSLTVDGKNIAVHLHQGDLPADVTFNGPIAVDSETLGLSLVRDPLCLVQLSDGGAEAHLVQLDRTSYEAPNLQAWARPAEDVSREALAATRAVLP